MKRCGLKVFLALGGLVTSAHAQTVRTVLETFYTSTNNSNGAQHNFSWAEFDVRFTPKDRATFSLIEMPTRRMYDEAAITHDESFGSIRFGRFRTSFGFNDWSELVYNGFNTRPLVRQTPLVSGLFLNRDDTGVEFLTWLGGLQVQAGILDTKSTAFQLVPQATSHASLRVQASSGRVIGGLNLLTGLGEKSRIYGLDLKASVPYLLFRGEAMKGENGLNAQRGYYGEFEFRVPKTTRTQIVWRNEGFKFAKEWVRLDVLGIRQNFLKSFTFNLNYCWSAFETVNSPGPKARLGWSLGTLYWITF